MRSGKEVGRGKDDIRTLALALSEQNRDMS